jgi:hypothetical protein
MPTSTPTRGCMREHCKENPTHARGGRTVGTSSNASRSRDHAIVCPSIPCSRNSASRTSAASVGAPASKAAPTDLARISLGSSTHTLCLSSRLQPCVSLRLTRSLSLYRYVCTSNIGAVVVVAKGVRCSGRPRGQRLCLNEALGYVGRSFPRPPRTHILQPQRCKRVRHRLDAHRRRHRRSLVFTDAGCAPRHTSHTTSLCLCLGRRHRQRVACLGG